MLGAVWVLSFDYLMKILKSFKKPNNIRIFLENRIIFNEGKELDMLHIWRAPALIFAL